jgi:hypothetical protein
MGVVNLSFRFIAQNLVGFSDLFERLGSVGGRILVWMILQGHFPVGALDLRVCRILGDA